MLYELPEKMQRNAGWKDRRYSPIVNPNLNRSVDEEFLAREQLKAEREGMGQVALFASQHFNIEVGLALRAGRWPGTEHWQRRTDPSLTLDVRAWAE